MPLNLAIGVQTALEDLGVDPNGLDGVFGNDTRAALTSFQATNGLGQTPAAQGFDDVPQETLDALASRLDAKGFAHFP
ncbi:peptidoglycan-binding protein [Kitasatospora sp. NPDC091207]|uniref:peptidoglycan-binding domain-containing protein n=1 Tax=Kitasatospora sp. NPDC091207 TaxID=3364083 RepID=UPI003830D243